MGLRRGRLLIQSRHVDTTHSGGKPEHAACAIEAGPIAYHAVHKLRQTFADRQTKACPLVLLNVESAKRVKGVKRVLKHDQELQDPSLRIQS